MPKRNNYRLSESQVNELEQAIKSHEDLRVHERARRLHKGYKPGEMAELLAVSVSQVYW